LPSSGMAEPLMSVTWLTRVVVARKTFLKSIVAGCVSVCVCVLGRWDDQVQADGGRRSLRIFNELDWRTSARWFLHGKGGTIEPAFIDEIQFPPRPVHNRLPERISRSGSAHDWINIHSASQIHRPPAANTAFELHRNLVQLIWYHRMMFSWAPGFSVAWKTWPDIT
jgi:hypothetical protein